MFTMDKLLLTLTLVTLSTGVLCTVAQNQTEDEATAGHASAMLPLNLNSKNGMVCVNPHELKDNYVYTPGMGAYKLHKHPHAAWTEARQECMEEGAILAVINSVSEARMLVEWMVREDVQESWIGIHDMYESDHWVTVTGQSLTSTGFDKWLPGEPNNSGGNEHCGTLKLPGGLNDLTCSRKRPYFCKIYVC